MKTCHKLMTIKEFKAKPLVLPLDGERFLLWYRNLSQIRILNVRNLAFEPVIMLGRQNAW